MSGKDKTESTGTQTLVTDDAGTITTTDVGTETTTDETDATKTIANTGTRTLGIQESHGGLDSVAGSVTTSEDKTTGRERSGRHFGNIGNITSQKMIGEEIDLWKWNYMREVLNDVKEFCTLPVYLNANRWSLVDQED